MISTNEASSKAGVHDTESKMVADGVFVKALSFEGGDLIILPGACNVAYKHSVEIDSSITAPRVSIVLRMVDADTVHPEENYYIRKGVRLEGKSNWPRQTPLPKPLQDRLLSSTLLLLPSEEGEQMGLEDMDAGVARIVGVGVQRGNALVASFITPYWCAAGRRSLVKGLVDLYSKIHETAQRSSDFTQTSSSGPATVFALGSSSTGPEGANP